MIIIVTELPFFVEVALIKCQFVQHAEANFGNDLSIGHLRSNPINHGTPN
jgi:hypothetical protein